MVEWDVRRFGFVTGEEEYATLADAVDFLLWRPTGMTGAQYEAAHDSVYAQWDARLERAGRGELRITDADVTDPGSDHPLGRIERIAFTVTLCPHGDEALEPKE